MPAQETELSTSSKAKARIILVYLVLFFVCTMSFVGLNVFFVNSAIDDKYDAFNRQSNEAYQHLLQVTQSTNYLLDGFSALISGVGLTKYESVKQYANQVLNRVPHIYQIQVAQRVEKDQLQAFNTSREGGQDFSVKVLEDTAIIDATESERPYFYPITLVVDREGGSYSNLGIDIMSFPFLSPSVRLSAIKQNTVISEPFETFDEQTVFVMVQPAFFESDKEPDLYTFLLIKSDVLLNPALREEPYRMSIGVQELDSDLLRKEGETIDSLTWFLPRFNYERTFDIGAQHLTLRISHQMQWSEINLIILVTLWAAAILVLVSLMVMFRLHFKAELVKWEQSELLYEMANFDSLTHLANRRSFNESLNYAVNQAARRSSRIGLLFMDLDGFKSVNDHFGHEAGDEVLKLAANKISSCVREVDVIGRLGGDEFGVILNDLSNEQDGELTRSRILSAIESIHQVGDYPVNIGISIGLALYPQDAKSAEELLTLSDERMYQNKRARKSSSVVSFGAAPTAMRKPS